MTLRLILPLVSAALLLAGCDDAAAPPPRSEVTVRAIPVTLQSYEDSVALTGEIAARTRSVLSFRVSGQIVERLADVGDHVASGDVLARIDPREQEADLYAARAGRRAAEARLRLARAAFERQDSLLQQGFTTRAVHERAEEGLRLAQGALETAEAQAGQAEEALANTVLRAPGDGVITARSGEAGQIAQAAQPIFTLAADGPRDAVFQAFESIFFNEFADKPIALQLISNPEIAADGAVREVSPTIDTRSGTVRVIVGVGGAAEAMPLGAAVLGRAYLAPKMAVIAPWSALDTHDGAPTVWVVDPQTRAVTRRAVTVDKYVTGAVILKDGLSDGDLMVVEGIKFLHQGQIVALAGEATR